jgi:hypothetical protein
LMKSNLLVLKEIQYFSSPRYEEYFTSEKIIELGPNQQMHAFCLHSTKYKES